MVVGIMVALQWGESLIRQLDIVPQAQELLLARGSGLANRRRMGIYGPFAVRLAWRTAYALPEAGCALSNSDPGADDACNTSSEVGIRPQTALEVAGRDVIPAGNPGD